MMNGKLLQRYRPIPSALPPPLQSSLDLYQLFQCLQYQSSQLFPLLSTTRPEQSTTISRALHFQSQPANQSSHAALHQQEAEQSSLAPAVIAPALQPLGRSWHTSWGDECKQSDRNHAIHSLGSDYELLYLVCKSSMNSDLQAGIWFGSVALSPIITLPPSLCFSRFCLKSCLL